MALKLTHPPAIMYDEHGPEFMRFAAEELTRYLTAILGAPPAKTAAKGQGAIHLETVADAELGDEGYEIVCQGNALHLRGGGPGGLVFSVYEFLRQYAGCQFSGLGADGEHVPRLNAIAVPEGRVRRKPQLWYRGLQFFWREDLPLMIKRIDWMAKNGMNYVVVTPRPDLPAYEDTTTVDPATGRVIEIKAKEVYTNRWFRANLLPEIMKRGLKVDMNHHNLHFWLPPELYFKEHPEWYPLIAGVRTAARAQLSICTSNPEAVATLIANLKRYLRENPEVKMVGLIPEDGGGWCYCDKCRQLDYDVNDVFGRTGDPRLPENINHSKARRYANLVNQAARAIRAEFPEVLLGSAHYSDLMSPPKDVPLELNVVPWVAMYWRCSKHLLSDPQCSINPFFFDRVTRWRKAHKGRLILYEYYMGMFAQMSLPYPIAELICREWPELKALGLDGAMIQSTSANHHLYGLNYLAFARSGWEDRVDYRQLQADYLLGMFGAAAPAIQPIYAELDRAFQALIQDPPDNYKYKLGRADCRLPFSRNVLAIPQGKGFGFIRDCLAKALAGAQTDRERRQLQRLQSAVRYWQAAADALAVKEEIAHCERRIGELAAEAYLKLGPELRAVDTLTMEGWRDVNWSSNGSKWLNYFLDQANPRVFDRHGKLVLRAHARAPAKLTLTRDGAPAETIALTTMQTIKTVADSRMRVQVDNLPDVSLVFNGVAFQAHKQQVTIDVRLQDDSREPGGKKVVWTVS